MSDQQPISADPIGSLSVDSRILVGEDRCTIRYRGPVVGTLGEWLGVEWDDPARGKHDGIKDGVTYFQCRYVSHRVLMNAAKI
jgi:dynactin complex subunit